MKHCHVRGRDGETLLEVLRLGHQPIDAPCAGKTRCVRCLVRLGEEHVAGEPLSAPTQLERELVGSKRLADGWRLACRVYFEKDASICVAVPDARLEIPDFPVRKRRESRRKDISFPVIAVDIGTTTVVAVLADGNSGDVIARVAESNCQRSWGADVVARIESSVASARAHKSMHELVHTQIESMLHTLLQQSGLSEYPPVYMCGNTTMLHLLEGADLRGLAAMPFEPAFLESRSTTVGTGGIRAQLIGGISAFVGADIMAGLYACAFDRPVSAPRLLVDIGTNGEMALAMPDRIYVTATAAGPAFEGELISCGSPAVEGAIDHVWIDKDEIRFSTIGHAEALGIASGICGSGLLDLLACLRRRDVVDECGRFTTETPGFSFGPGLPELSQADVRSLQLAKGAIAAGIDILCQKAGIQCWEIDTLFLAGGFGSTLLPESALDIGLLPASVRGRIETAGNTALSGTLLLAAQPELRAHMSVLLERITVIDLARETGFQDAFMEAMLFPELN